MRKRVLSAWLWRTRRRMRRPALSEAGVPWLPALSGWDEITWGSLFFNQIRKIRQAYKLLGAENQLQVFYYAKYATPDLRPLDNRELPDGITDEEYFRYANVDPSKHRFRPERAVPWLAKVFEI